jgi:hypothetical protein
VTNRNVTGAAKLAQEACVTDRRCGMRWVVSLAMVQALGTVVVEPVAAQSTIFNVPTTDTVAVGKGYFEFDYLPQVPEPNQRGRFQTYTPRIVFGVVPNLEAGVNVANSHFHNKTFSLFEPNAKYKFYADDAQGLAAAAGIIGYIPINHRGYSPTFALVYGNISKKFKGSNYGPRITFGPYGVVGDISGPNGGVLAGYEQPITAAISIVADWFSGKNFFGFLTPGVSIVLPHNGLFNIGYSFGNDSFERPGNGNRELFVFYGIAFP